MNLTFSGVYSTYPTLQSHIRFFLEHCFIDDVSCLCAGTSTPPSIAATPVPALPPPIAVNSYPSVPAPPNGQSATEALYTNGVHAYQGKYTENKLNSHPRQQHEILLLLIYRNAYN